VASTDENKLLVRRYYEEVVTRCALDRVPEFIAPDYAEIYDNIRYESGIVGAKEHISGGHRTYANLRLTVERQIAEGDWVVTQLIARGVHSGVWMGIAPTGKPVEFTCVNVDRVVGGRIVEHGGAANMLGPLLKVGALRVVGPEETEAQQ
jgi:predicted ester cyclase